MDEMTEQVAFLKGEVHALLLFSQLLASTHPDPRRILPRLVTAEQKGLAQLEGSTLPDAAVEGFRFVIDGLKQVLSTAPGN
jgi:hypothetical protein